MSRAKKADPGLVFWTVAGAIVAVVFFVLANWLSHHPELETPPWPKVGRPGVYR